jgi:hypothetical protein
MIPGMDEGLPIAYKVREKHSPVYTSDRVQIGTVDHIVAAYDKDIFHGIVINTNHGKRLVLADQVNMLHERGVDIEVGAAAVDELEPPSGEAL